MWDWRAIKGLEEEGRGIDCVEGCAFRPAAQLVSAIVWFIAEFPFRGVEIEVAGRVETRTVSQLPARPFSGGSRR